MSGENQRNQVINDILFSKDPPSIDEVLSKIPKSTTTRGNVWSSNIISWDSWSAGTLTKAYEIKDGQNQNGWGSQGSHQRGMIENNVYYTVKVQNGLLLEQEAQIKDLISNINDLRSIIQTTQSKISKKDEWVNIEETVTMV